MGQEIEHDTDVQAVYVCPSGPAWKMKHSVVQRLNKNYSNHSEDIIQMKQQQLVIQKKKIQLFNCVPELFFLAILLPFSLCLFLQVYAKKINYKVCAAQRKRIYCSFPDLQTCHKRDAPDSSSATFKLAA